MSSKSVEDKEKGAKRTNDIRTQDRDPANQPVKIVTREKGAGKDNQQ